MDNPSRDQNGSGDESEKETPQIIEESHHQIEFSIIHQGIIKL